MDKRKRKRWLATFERYDYQSLVYRREAYVYRNLNYFLDKQEANELVDELASTFGVARPEVRASYASTKLIDNDYQAAFFVHHTLDTQWIHLRLNREFVKKAEWWATDDRCNRYLVWYYNIPARTIRCTAVLHEFAHYLAAIWWGHAPHDQIFLAVNEALHDWYKRKKRKAGIFIKPKLVRTTGKE